MATNILQQRGIEKAACDLSWVAANNPYDNKTPGFSYPVFCQNGETISGLTRWKAGDSSNKPKYVWFPAKDEREKDGIQLPTYYTPKGLKEAIEKNRGELHFVSGEPDLLTLRSVGFRNVTCAFGERSLDGLVEFLSAMNVKKVYYWRDLDETGLESAKSFRDALLKSDIVFECRLLAGSSKEGYDLNKLWCNCQFDRSTFLQTLQASPAEKLPTSPKQPASRAKNAPNPALEALREQWCLEVEKAAVSAWNLGSADGSGFGKNHIPCPFHRDTEPSAHWNYRTHGLQCFGACGKHYNTDEVAEQLNHESFDAFKDRNKPQRPKPLVRTSAQPKQQPPRQKANRNGKFPIVSGKEAADRAFNIIQGKSISELPPIHAFWKPFWQFKGRIEWWTPRQIMLMISGSGMGKTALCERICDNGCMSGHYPLLWGPEWTSVSYFYRRVNRYAGISLDALEMNEAWQFANAHNLDTSGLKKLSDAEIKAVAEVRRQVKSWPGDNHYLDKAGSISHIFGEKGPARDKVNELRAEGHDCSLAVIDYTQKGTAELTHTAVEKTIEDVTRFAADMNMFVILLSQVNKDQANRLINHGKLFDMTSAQYMSDKQFNAVVTLNPVYKNKERYEQAWVRAVKNSTAAGQGKIKVRTKLDRNDWGDEVLVGIESETTQNGYDLNTEGPPPKEYRDEDEPVHSWVKD